MAMALQYVVFKRNCIELNLTQFTFYFFQVKVTQKLTGFESPQEIRKLKRGEYFGEKALLRYEEYNQMYLPFCALTLPMLRLLSPKAQGCKNLLKNI